MLIIGTITRNINYGTRKEKYTYSLFINIWAHFEKNFPACDSEITCVCI